MGLCRIIWKLFGCLCLGTGHWTAVVRGIMPARPMIPQYQISDIRHRLVSQGKCALLGSFLLACLEIIPLVHCFLHSSRLGWGGV